MAIGEEETSQAAFVSFFFYVYVMGGNEGLLAGWLCQVFSAFFADLSFFVCFLGRLAVLLGFFLEFALWSLDLSNRK